MATIPILKIKKIVDLILAFITTDYTNQTVKTNSFLYRVIGDNDDNGFDYYAQAVSIFTKISSDKRKLETRLGFDPDRAMLPTIHIRQPSKIKGKSDGIGLVGLEGFTNEDDTITPQARVSYSSRFELMVTSINSMEVIIIAEILESALLASYESLTGIDQWVDLINFDTKEMIMMNDSLPKPIFSISIGVNTSFEKNNIPKLYTEKNIQTIEFENPELLNL